MKNWLFWPLAAIPFIIVLGVIIYANVIPFVTFLYNQAKSLVKWAISLPSKLLRRLAGVDLLEIELRAAHSRISMLGELAKHHREDLHKLGNGLYDLRTKIPMTEEDEFFQKSSRTAEIQMVARAAARKVAEDHLTRAVEESVTKYLKVAKKTKLAKSNNEYKPAKKKK